MKDSFHQDDMIKKLIDETNPSLIISFYPKFAVHPDHEATGEAVVFVIRVNSEFRIE
jgi:LmbE family N-acetylglucosaminyl deacetylase